MRRFPVLVTALHLSVQAQQILADAGGELLFMDDPVDEEALIACFRATPIEWIV